MAGTIVIDGIDIHYATGYDPINLTKRLTRLKVIGGTVVQDFGLIDSDGEITLQGIEVGSVILALIARIKVKGVTYTLTDRWNNQFTVIIRSVNAPPIQGTTELYNYNLTLVITEITKLYSVNW
jgi:hypothetical protein